MVNNQTSQYELLNNFFSLFRLGIFQYVRDILQLTVLLDHPVQHRRVYSLIIPRTDPPLQHRRVYSWIIPRTDPTLQRRRVFSWIIPRTDPTLSWKPGIPNKAGGIP